MKFRNGHFGFADLLMMLAIVLFFLAGVGYAWTPAPWPWNGRLIAIGLFCWALSSSL
jgi:hypothetical protein